MKLVDRRALDAYRPAEFLGITAGASLKRGGGGRGHAAPDHEFLGITAGASLKLPLYGLYRRTNGEEFLGITAGASLKPAASYSRLALLFRNSSALLPGPH